MIVIEIESSLSLIFILPTRRIHMDIIFKNVDVDVYVIEWSTMAWLDTYYCTVWNEYKHHEYSFNIQHSTCNLFVQIQSFLFFVRLDTARRYQIRISIAVIVVQYV